MDGKQYDQSELDGIMLRDAKRDGRFGVFVFAAGENGFLSSPVACSESIRSLFGAGPARLKTVEDWLALADDRRETEAWIREGVARLQRNFTRVVRLRRASDALRIWIRLSAELERGPGGKGLRVSGTVESLGSGAEAEDAEFRAALYSSQMEASLDGILVVDGDDRILSFNRRFVEMWGVPEETLRSGFDSPVLSFVKGRLRDPEAFLEKVARLYDHRGELSRDTLELSDGRAFDRYSAPVLGEGGHYFGRIWYFRDVTESKRSERDLRLSESAFRNVFNFPIIGVTVIKDRTFVRANPAFAERMGYTEEEVIGRSVRMFYADDGEYERTGRKLYEELDSTGLGQAETRFVRKDGQPMDVVIYSRALDPGHPEHGVASIVLDVTDMKAAERERDRLKEQFAQAQKMESIGRLAGGVAHDFNNLLTAIIGNAELAMAKLPPGNPAQDYLSGVIRAGESAAELTGRLLAFSRKQVIDLRNIDVNELLGNMKKMLERIIGEDVDLQAAAQPGLPAISVDPSQIQQIILNLAVNARDAMPDGGRLTLETALVVLDGDYCARHANARPGEWVMLAVSDTGQGMTAEVLSHLFEPFFTTKAPGKGTGLGLATVYGAVKQNGGIIDVYSEPGKGTVFKIYFPPSIEARDSGGERVLDSAASSGGGETILLAEDNAMVREFAQDVLRSLGYRVISTSSGEEALVKAIAFKEHIDLLMTDIVMEGMNGKVLADELRRHLPEVKVLYCSGYTENLPSLRESLESGDGFIGKPFSSASLSKKLRQLLDGGNH